jgi:ABC-2 type transport system permease protein
MLLLHLTAANIKMIVRNRQSLFWAMAFPIIMLVVFGLISQGRTVTTTIAVVDDAQDAISRRLIEDIGQTQSFTVELRHDPEAARGQIRDGDLDYLLLLPEGLEAAAREAPPARVSLLYDEFNPDSLTVIRAVERFLDRINLDMAGARSRLTLTPEGVLANNQRFIDFLLPGIAIWGIMGFSIIGVATTMAGYREKKILRRIQATPLDVRTFFVAQVIAYLVLSLVQATIILGVGTLAFNVQIAGNLFVIGLLVLLGNIVFLNLGFIVGAYSKSVQAASGLGNVVVLPLLMFSGVFFPADALPGVVSSIVGVMPLAPMVEAMRGVTLQAKGITDFPRELAIIGAWLVGTSLVAVKVFRFQ